MMSVVETPILAPGTQLLPGYEVVAHLSRGHRLDVYDAWSITRQARCVVKVLRPDRRGEPRARQLLLDEGRLLRDLGHPHLVRAYEVVSEPEPGVVLETLTGPSLADVIDDRRRLGVTDVALLGAQLASALLYLHRHGWVHCDVTSANVVVEGTRAMLIDLSLARAPGSGSRGMGTRGYRAPEQRTGAPVSEATDTWGLGIVLHEAACGRLPDEPPTRRGFGLRREPRVPASLAPVLAGCLQKEPSRRWPLPRVLSVLEQLNPLR